MKSILFKLFILSLVIYSCDSEDETTTPPDNSNFILEEEIPTPNRLPMAVVKNFDSNHFFVALKDGGITSYRRGTTTEVVSNIPISELENLHAMQLDLQGDYLYVALGDFFGPGSKAGLAIIDVSDPENLVVTDTWASDVQEDGTAVVKISGDYAYVGAMKEGVYVLDISNKTNIVTTSLYQPDINFPLEDPNSVQHPNARGMDIKGTTLYLCYDAGGIRALDISNPSQLNEIGRYINPDSAILQKAYNNIVVNGSVGYAAVDYCGLEVLDISDPTAITLIGWWNPWACNTSANNWFNSNGHANQLVYDSDQEVVYISTGKSELNVIDVSTPTNPVATISYGSPSNLEATWGLTRGNSDVYLLYITSLIPFQSDWAGIRIVTENSLFLN